MRRLDQPAFLVLLDNSFTNLFSNLNTPSESSPNRVRDLIFTFCSNACLEPQKEPPNLLRDCGMRPADVAFQHNLGVTWPWTMPLLTPSEVI
jgi:hypothetical protein